MRSLAVLVLTCALSAPAFAQENLTELVEEARKLPRPPARYLENIKVGMRGVTFHQFKHTARDPKTMYVTSFQGFVFGTNDGGQSWTEGRLTTERVKFFGALRPRTPVTGAPFSVETILKTAQQRGFMNVSLTDMNQLAGGTSGINYLDEDRSGPSPFASLKVPGGLRYAGDYSLHDRGGDQGGGGDAMRYGIGLTRAALRMQALLKKKRFRLIGMNLKLMINIRGMEPTPINYVAIHPDDPRTILVATAMGVYKSTDGGLGYDHVFPGRSLSERWCNVIQYHPTDPNIVFLGTDQGLMISRDGGDKFGRPTGTQLSTAPTKWVEIDEKNPDIVYAGTTIGAFRSNDGGRTWRWIYYETLNTQNRVMNIAIDPDNPDIATVATADGLFRTENGGIRWKRSGGFLFTGVPVYDIRFDPRDGQHQVCITYRRAWETFDGGKSWSIIYINDSEWSPRDIAFDPTDPNVLWVLTSAEILRLSPHPPKAPKEQGLGGLRARLAMEPGLSQTMDAAFRFHRAHRGELGALRNRARLSGFLPTVNAFAGYMDFDAGMNLDAIYTDYSLRPRGGRFAPTQRFRQDRWTAALGEKERFELQRNKGFQFPYWGVFLQWDLSAAVFHMEEAPYGRYFRQANALYLRLRAEVQRLYEERRRVLIQLYTASPDNLRGRLMLLLRLEELTAHLTALTDGLFDESLAWVQGLNWLGDGTMSGVGRPHAGSDVLGELEMGEN
jgi:hypothetical protein